MSLKIVETDLNDRGGVITVEGASQEEVLSSKARSMVINHASSQGISRAGTSGQETAYPVNADGETPDDLIFGRNGQTTAAYRCDFKIQGGI